MLFTCLTLEIYSFVRMKKNIDIPVHSPNNDNLSDRIVSSDSEWVSGSTSSEFQLSDNILLEMKRNIAFSNHEFQNEDVYEKIHGFNSSFNHDSSSIYSDHEYSSDTNDTYYENYQEYESSSYLSSSEIDETHVFKRIRRNENVPVTIIDSIFDSGRNYGSREEFRLYESGESVTEIKSKTMNQKSPIGLTPLYGLSKNDLYMDEILHDCSNESDICFMGEQLNHNTNEIIYIEGEDAKKSRHLIKDSDIELVRTSSSIELIGKRRIPTLLHQKLEALGMRFVSETCLICLTDVNETYDLKCKHTFHKECLLRWLYSCNLCPCCRAPVVLGIFYGRRIE